MANLNQILQFVYMRKGSCEVRNFLCYFKYEIERLVPGIAEIAVIGSINQS